MIPANLLQAISSDGGGLLSIVIGAGCSKEPPSSIPLAREIATEANRRLVEDGVLAANECAHPADLAALASLVYAKTGSQKALVERFPLSRLRMTPANDGYRCLVALMAEGAISHVLSLNFDTAVQSAAAELGLSVHVVAAPGAPIPIGPTLVHLHGTANGSAESLVLRQEAIDTAWKQSWQQIVAQQILAAPNVLFAGLGSAAPVLSETVQMIRDAVGDQKTQYQVDVNAHGQNHFAQQLNIAADRYIQAGWSAAMTRLANRLLQEQVNSLRNNGAAILTGNGGSEEEINRFKDTVAALGTSSLLSLGKFRAHARLHRNGKYLPRTTSDEELMTGPLSALATFCAAENLILAPASNGLWQLRKGTHLLGSVLIATGGGTRKVTALETSIRAVSKEIAEISGTAPDVILLGGVVGDSSLVQDVLPTDILEGEEISDIVSGPPESLILVSENPQTPGRMKEWLDGP